VNSGASSLSHCCSACGQTFALPPLHGAIARILYDSRAHIGVGEYVYAVCPACGHKDWAEERRFWGVFGPRAIYAVSLLLVLLIVGAVFYLGFVGL